MQHAGMTCFDRQGTAPDIGCRVVAVDTGLRQDPRFRPSILRFANDL